MKELENILSRSNNYIKGIPAAPGLVIGKAFLYVREKIAVQDGIIVDPDEAIFALGEAIAKSKKELMKVFNLAKEKMGAQRAGIFEAQLMILDDTVLFDSIRKRIKHEHRLPEYIVSDEIARYQEMMIISSVDYLKERALDIEDIKNRIIRNLQKKRWESKILEDVIVISELLSPADTILFSRRNVKGYITDHGGLTSHAAIIARSLDIPAVVGSPEATTKIYNGDLIIVDGFDGYIFIKPNEEQVAFFEEKIRLLGKVNEQLAELKDKPSETQDGHAVSLYANIDLPDELSWAIANKASGIGLFRTEQLIENTGEFPDEDEQTTIYQNIAQKMYPEVVTIRAFDLGGDKVRHFLEKEVNPFLGLRGIRFLLDNRRLFKTQVRAVLRASNYANVQFMIPMVSVVEEIRETKNLVLECMEELRASGARFDEHLQIGTMIEVPSAAILADELAKETDFFSIGTNDLIQYIMAVDRGNDRVSGLYQEFNPAVLRMLKHIIDAGKKAGISVSLCGEMASDNLAVPLLIGMGLDILSMSAAALFSVKRTVRSTSYEGCRRLVDDCLACSTAAEVDSLMQSFFAQYNIQRTRNIL